MTSYSSGKSFTGLPNEVLELIFYHIPLPDLLRNTSLVCKKWHSIISATNFSTYRKGYYRYKMASSVEKQRMLHRQINAEGNWTLVEPDASMGPLVIALHKPGTYLKESDVVSHGLILGEGDVKVAVPWLIRFVSDNFKSDFTSITNHSKYEAAATLVEEMFPEVAGQNKSAAIVAILCVIAEDVWDVREVIARLAMSNKCRVKDASELLYSIASALLHFHCHLKVTMRPHFLLYQALYYYENDWTYDASLGSSQPGPSRKRKAGQTTLFNFTGFTTNKKSAASTPTTEQLAVIKQPIIPGENYVTKIIAFAGTGKTTTLIRLCEEYPHLKFLVVVYNRSAKDHAAGCFPKNVKCITAHGMAMKKKGWLYTKKLTSDLKTQDIIDADVLPKKEDTKKKKKKRKSGDDEETYSYHRRAAMVLKTLHNFICSVDPAINDEHVPVLHTGEEVSAAVQNEVLEGATKAWSMMIDPESNLLRMTHDGYLKVWQLSNPNLRWMFKEWQHDVLLIDEAQDMNPAMLDIFMKQTNTPKIFVGDPHQQIYLFRGAVNALDLVEADKVAFLTQSFRFGPEIAYLANNCLKIMQGENKKILVGGKKIDKLIYRPKIEAGVKYGQVAILARKNSTLFSQAVKRLCDQPKEGIQCTGFFVGGTDHFDDLLQIFYLKSGEKEKMTKYKKFPSFQALKAFAKNTEDATLLGKINTVLEFDHKLPQYICKLREILRTAKNKDKADYVFSTIHKAKGLEWDSVLIIDDFDWLDERFDWLADDEDESKPWYEVFKSFETKIDLPEDQKNMLYVAVTRAKSSLQMTYNLMRLLLSNRDDQVRIGARGPSASLRSQLVCAECNAAFQEDRPFIFSKLLVGLMDGTQIINFIYTPQEAHLREGMSATSVSNIAFGSRDFSSGLSPGQQILFRGRRISVDFW